MNATVDRIGRVLCILQLGFAVADGDELAGGDVIVVDQVALDGVGAALGQILVEPNSTAKIYGGTLALSAGNGIGVEKLGARKNFLKALAKSAFARGNSARDPNRRHNTKAHRGVMPSARST